MAAQLVKKSNCKVTAPLCSRVALMVSQSSLQHVLRPNFEFQRSVYMIDSSSSFWKSVDFKLAEIRNKAGTGDTRDKRIAK
jgi:hypothetical protein